jgi:hypothetical protein
VRGSKSRPCGTFSQRGIEEMDDLLPQAPAVLLGRLAQCAQQIVGQVLSV